MLLLTCSFGVFAAENFKPLENVENYTKPPHKYNMMYDLWNLKETSLLVRSHIHGVMNTNRRRVRLVDLTINKFNKT